MSARPCFLRRFFKYDRKLLGKLCRCTNQSLLKFFRTATGLKSGARAAETLNKSRSDFILETACREAENILLDQRLFLLDEDRFSAFEQALQAPVPEKLKRLLSTKAPCDPIPLTAQFITGEFDPATLPLTMFPDRQPYVLNVYLVSDPAPPPRDPEPLGREIKPVIPIQPSLPVGEARYRRALLAGRTGQPAREVKHDTDWTPPERAARTLRQALGQVNDDLAAHDMPLHLVLTKDSSGYGVNVYDCSYGELCRISYSTPLDLTDLSKVLVKLRYESGNIVDRIT